MTYTTRALGDEWGIDTIFKFNGATASRLRAATYLDNPLTFAWRYVSLVTRSTADITRAELVDLLENDWTVLLCEHAWKPGTVLTADLGQRAGNSGVEHALDVGYALGSDLVIDLEGAGPGSDAAGYVEANARIILDGGFRPKLYVGYAAGLNPEQLWLLDLIHGYTSDAGPREVLHRGFQSKQGLQTTIAGIGVDPEHAHPDLMGDMLVGMVAAPDIRVAT